jgi:hypothetical protein
MLSPETNATNSVVRMMIHISVLPRRHEAAVKV